MNQIFLHLFPSEFLGFLQSLFVRGVSSSFAT